MTLPRRIRALVFAMALLPALLIPLHAGGQPRTLQSFGVTTKYGQPVYPLPSNVALGLFDPDPLLDLAYFADGKIQVYRNLGNGTFELVGERRVASDVARMEWGKERMWDDSIFDQFSWGVLHLLFRDGSERTITRSQLLPADIVLTPPQQVPMAPPIDFREVWRSPSQTQPTRFMAINDIDNDGRIEIAYAFYEFSSDSVRFVLYECAGPDSFVVDWDTVIFRAYGPFAITDVDTNGQKELVLGRSVPGSGQVVLLECLGERSYKFYETSITYTFPPFKALEADINRNGRKELIWHTSNPSAPPGQDATFIFVSEFAFKTSTTISFSTQVARYAPYTFNMAVGQIDGTGWDEIIPSGGSFGVNEPVPIEYLWHNGTSWTVRQIHTGLRSGTTAEMFVNLDADSAKELFIGGVGPVGHGSCYALKYVSDTTWAVMWADSSLRNTPLSVNAGILGGQFVVAGANTVDRFALDTLYTDLNVYQPSGAKLGIWRRDSASVQNFRFLDIDNHGTANLVAPMLWRPPNHHLAVYEFSGSLDVAEPSSFPSERFNLSQNYPNPFNPATTFLTTIPTRSAVRIAVFDILGREVKRIVDDNRPAGQYTFVWNGQDQRGLPVSSGVYFVRMEAKALQGESFVQTRKVLLLR